ncbi:MAG: FAD binding domain-containing protein [Dehalococcoidia bacterium]|nr:FAD binding domain-containing protein [Dehalococcoidia bacterium]
MRAFSYFAPKTVEEACGILRTEESSFALAGGTDLLVSVKRGTARAKALVDLKGIPELQRLEVKDGGGLWIGAAVPLYVLEGDPNVRRLYPAVALAAENIASYQIRNRGTVGGNLCLDTRCWYYNLGDLGSTAFLDCRKRGGETCYAVRGGDRCYAIMSADLVPALVALEAKVAIAGGNHGLRTLALEDFYTGDGVSPNVLQRGEVLVGVEVPGAQNLRASYLKYHWRRSIDFGLATLAAAVRLDDRGTITAARLVLGGVNSAPVRARHAEELLVKGLAPEEIATEAAKETNIFSGVFASVGYRKRLVRVLVEDAVTKMVDDINGHTGKIGRS